MAIGISCGVLHHTARFSTIGNCTSSEQFQKSTSCCGTRTSSAGVDFRRGRQQRAGDSRLTLVRNSSNQDRKIVPRAGRSLLYESAMSYVLIEPGQDEEFVTLEELQERLKSWLLKWPANELPEDLQKFESLDEVVIHLVDSACELNLGGGLGSLQWFEVRLES